MSSDLLFTPLSLPNGRVLKNRLCKAAMEENLSDWGQLPGLRLRTLYGQWGKGGLGLMLTGNVMVAPDALTGPGGVVLQQNTDLEPFRSWAAAAKQDGSHIWMQINHPGRQVYAAMGEQAVSPSVSAIDLGRFSSLFAEPKALSVTEIAEIVERFTITAQRAEDAGFDGCQIHAAHGYLISQFLSPRVNKRTDQYGGSLENRARLLLEIVDAIATRVSPEFCLSVKLNSADFQKGGFSLAEAQTVVKWLNTRRIDLVELSGGSYESPAMQGKAASPNAVEGADTQNHSSTLQREAYFVEFAREVAQVAQMPVMVTGGISRHSVAIEAIKPNAQGFAVDMLGVARALAYEPMLAKLWQSSQATNVKIPQVGWSNQTLGALATMAITKAQLDRMAHGKKPNPNMNPLLSLIRDQWLTRQRTKRYRRWRQQTKS